MTEAFKEKYLSDQVQRTASRKKHLAMSPRSANTHVKYIVQSPEHKRQVANLLHAIIDTLYFDVKERGVFQKKLDTFKERLQAASPEVLADQELLEKINEWCAAPLGPVLTIPNEVLQLLLDQKLIKADVIYCYLSLFDREFPSYDRNLPYIPHPIQEMIPALRAYYKEINANNIFPTPASHHKQKAPVPYTGEQVQEILRVRKLAALNLAQQATNLVKTPTVPPMAAALATSMGQVFRNKETSLPYTSAPQEPNPTFSLPQKGS